MGEQWIFTCSPTGEIAVHGGDLGWQTVLTVLSAKAAVEQYRRMKSQMLEENAAAMPMEFLDKLIEGAKEFARRWPAFVWLERPSDRE